MLTFLRHLADRFDALPWQAQLMLCALVLLTATCAIGVSYIMRQDLVGEDWPTADSIASAKEAQRVQRIEGGLDPETGWPLVKPTAVPGSQRRRPYCDDAATPERRARLKRMQGSRS